MPTNFVNLTPHDIHIYSKDGDVRTEFIRTFKPDGTVARVSVVTWKVGMMDDVPMFKSKTGEVVGLPNPVPGTVWIVSTMVREAVKGRMDVASPGELIRNSKGEVVGCIGLAFN